MAEKKRAFGYICPKCGKSVYAERTEFALNAAAVAVVCDCGKSELTAETDGRTFRITTVTEDNKAVHHEIKSPFFDLFIDAMIRFFETGEAPVTHAQTIDVIAIRAAAVEACGTPFRWIEL